jgi:hypothetical protein
MYDRDKYVSPHSLKDEHFFRQYLQSANKSPKAEEEIPD